ncbi:MAG: RIP metalloprotease RseP [Bdellovibrionales bacterium]|nr:RIP metalloprotease RseP [Bdellovibrionales bacterium]
MDILMILVSILALGVLVFVHELGHFLFAKWNGVGVIEFAIGFGKPIYQRQKGETVYSLRLIPLGGFVRMLGDDPRDLLPKDPESEEESDPVEAISSEIHPLNIDDSDRSRWFLSKGFCPKAAIVFAGPLFNILFAIFLSFLSFSVFGRPALVTEPIVGATLPKYPAEKAGMLEDDRILSVNGVSVTTWEDMAKSVAQSKGEELVLEIERPAKDPSSPLEHLSIELRGTQDSGELALLSGDDSKSFRIGVLPKTVRKPISIPEAAEASLYHIWRISSLTVRGLYGMIMGQVSTDNIAGPIFIFHQGAEAARTGVDRLIDFMIFLSVSLAILNLLPIPILDGGHLLFFVIEALRGAPVSISLQERAHQVGMALLLLLMLFAVSNDVVRIFGLSGDAQENAAPATNK